jgi:hypothetical protein
MAGFIRFATLHFVNEGGYNFCSEYRCSFRLSRGARSNHESSDNTQWPKRKVRRIYAQAASDQGVYLIQWLFLSLLLDYPDDTYVLAMQRKNYSKVIRQYQECIQKKSME